MKKRIRPNPRYKERNTTYGIDTCAPQREAIKARKIGFHALTHGAYPGTLLPTTVLPGLCSLGLIDARGEQDWGFDPHRNEGVEIVFLETGKMTFIANDHPYALRAGDVTITRPWELHSMGDPNLGTGLIHWLIIDVGVRHAKQAWKWPDWVMLAPADIRELTHTFRLNNNPVWKSTADIRHAFREIAFCIKQYRNTGIHSRLTIHVNHLLLSLLEAIRAQSRQDYPKRVTCERTVDAFLTELNHTPQGLNKPWTLNTMASECGMKATAFVAHCRHLTNMSPIDYVNRCRLEWAAQRLRAEPKTPITRIALECGFNTSQYFSTRFRRKYGRSPQTFRKHADGQHLMNHST